MSDLEQRDGGADFHAKNAPPAAMTAEAVITGKDQQATLGTKSESATYPLSNIDFVDAKAENHKTNDQGPKFEPPYYNLRYDYTVDPLEKGIGSLSMSFDSISTKMATLLDKPEIKEQGGFSLQTLKDTLNNPGLNKTFSEVEVNSLRLMANQARRLLDPSFVAKLDRKSFGGPDLPMDKLYITKNSVTAAGKQLGVIKEA